MPLFTPSTIPWVSAVQQVADSAGASSDSEMTTRAHNSLRAAFQYLGNRARWNFLRAEAVPVRVYPPFTLAITASAGVASASALTGHGVQIDDIIIGEGLIDGNRVSATGASGFGFFVANTATAAGASSYDITVMRDSYALPTDWKATYSVRLLGSEKALRYIGRRVYDRSITTEFTSGTTDRYDLFNSFGRSKIRLLPPPSVSDVLLHRYMRRMEIATASGVTSNLDIPEDYEGYVIAWAKWHFLTDKNEGRSEQATTWMSLAQEGVKMMLKDNVALPDEDLAFMPGHMILDPAGGDRSTKYIAWEY